LLRNFFSHETVKLSFKKFGFGHFLLAKIEKNTLHSFSVLKLGQEGGGAYLTEKALLGFNCLKKLAKACLLRT
jgi:hypothetical protein